MKSTRSTPVLRDPAPAIRRHGRHSTLTTGAAIQEQKDAHTQLVRIDEISRQLEVNGVLPVNENRSRSQSPPPRYDGTGRRTNTRRHRGRERLETELISIMDQAERTIPGFRRPPKFRGRSHRRIHDVANIPAREFPEVKFMGLLLGPRGRSLRNIEEQSGAKVVIRGNGSVKEGQERRDSSLLDEPLHCRITADSREKVEHAKQLIQTVIETATKVPEHENEMKKKQLRDLAVANGTFRNDGSRGQTFEERWGCTKRIQVICHACGNSGHIARDCYGRPRLEASSKVPPWRQKGKAPTPHGPPDAVDILYSEFMLDMGYDTGTNPTTHGKPQQSPDPVLVGEGSPHDEHHGRGVY